MKLRFRFFTSSEELSSRHLDTPLMYKKRFGLLKTSYSTEKINKRTTRGGGGGGLRREDTMSRENIHSRPLRGTYLRREQSFSRDKNVDRTLSTPLGRRNENRCGGGGGEFESNNLDRHGRRFSWSSLWKKKHVVIWSPKGRTSRDESPFDVSKLDKEELKERRNITRKEEQPRRETSVPYVYFTIID